MRLVQNPGNPESKTAFDLNIQKLISSFRIHPYEC